MQPEVMAEDEVNNVSLCHNDNYVTISNAAAVLWSCFLCPVRLLVACH